MKSNSSVGWAERGETIPGDAATGSLLPTHPAGGKLRHGAAT